MEHSVILDATLSLKQAATQKWDIIVVGGGPAGALAARQLASTDARVLLVDKSSFPRWKVCGCCLNLRSFSALRVAGLDRSFLRLDPPKLDRMVLGCSGRSASFALPGGYVLSRQAFDAFLVSHAIRSGVQFLPGTEATLDGVSDSARTVCLRSGSLRVSVEAAIVIWAAGLGGEQRCDPFETIKSNSRMSMDASGSMVSMRSRIGAGVIVDSFGDSCRTGSIYMSCAKSGYVGAVQLEDGRVNLAAALDPAAVRTAGGVGPAAAEIVESAAIELVPGIDRAAWKGTPPLTRQVGRPARRRVFLVGDSAGYVEPFTGEGIAWALTSALALADVVRSGLKNWSPETEARWIREHSRVVSKHQGICRISAGVLRRPWLVNGIIIGLRLLPEISKAVIGRLNKPYLR